LKIPIIIYYILVKYLNFHVRNYENTTDENSISSVVVFPDKDILEAGYDIGEFNVYYNFYRPALNSEYIQLFYSKYFS
jgi:hypothetical protein